MFKLPIKVSWRHPQQHSICTSDTRNVLTYCSIRNCVYIRTCTCIHRPKVNICIHAYISIPHMSTSTYESNRVKGTIL